MSDRVGHSGFEGGGDISGVVPLIQERFTPEKCDKCRVISPPKKKKSHRKENKRGGVANAMSSLRNAIRCCSGLFRCPASFNDYSGREDPACASCYGAAEESD